MTNLGTICTFDGCTPAEALSATGETELPVSGDALTRMHHGVTGFAVTGAEGQLWR